TDLKEVEPQVQTLATRRDQLEEQLASLSRYEATLRQLLPVTPMLIDLERYAVSAIWVERRYQPVLEILTQQLEELAQGLCEVVTRQVSQDIVVALLIFPKSQAKAVNELLGRENISQVRLPPDLADQSLEQALTNIQQRLQAIPQELAEIKAQQEVLAGAWRSRLLTWQALLRDHLAQLEVQTQFGQTDYTFVVEGWAPESRLAEIEAALQREVGEEIMVVKLPLSSEEQEQAPVMFDNPRLVAPFEPLLGLFALPRYGGFDPSPLMALFFPLFFGMILGDVAYGSILLILMLYLRRRFKSRPTLRSLAEVLSMGAVWTIVFGFLYGEFLGTLGEEIGLQPLWFDRGHNVQALFLLAIGLGAGHIVLGLCLGVWDGLRRHSRHTVIEKVAMLVALGAIFLLVAILAGYLPDSFFTPAIALLVVGMVMLIYSLGKLGLLLGPLELLGTVGNILSYLRIAAIGLSSVYLAQVANELAGLAGNLLVGLIIAGLFHALNLVLGTFSPTIQSLRLHYVEFFGKFYQGGGQPFRPFQRSQVTSNK
ncbi:MAG TPA: V-type ATPase 116kDa subunit family protein, partial [Anaerolineae bacterium]|nr:V-type ATPase 116kDa subunit family protein [Anaerolineae bacterium]